MQNFRFNSIIPKYNTIVGAIFLITTQTKCRDTAMAMFIENGGLITNRDIAQALCVDERKIAVWKHRQQWKAHIPPPARSRPAKRKRRGAPFGNQNAVGNRGGAPLGNCNRMIHGAYTKKDIRILLDDETVREIEEYAASRYGGLFRQEFCSLEMTAAYCIERLAIIERMDWDYLDILHAQVPIIQMWGRVQSKRAKVESNYVDLYCNLRKLHMEREKERSFSG